MDGGWLDATLDVCILDGGGVDGDTATKDRLLEGTSRKRVKCETH